MKMKKIEERRSCGEDTAETWSDLSSKKVSVTCFRSDEMRYQISPYRDRKVYIDSLGDGSSMILIRLSVSDGQVIRS